MATAPRAEAPAPDYAQGEAAAIARDLSTQEWTPFIDWSQTFPGNRGVNRGGRYELYDAPIGVRIRIEEADKSGPVLTANDRWEGEGNMVPLRVWQASKSASLLTVITVWGNAMPRSSRSARPHQGHPGSTAISSRGAGASALDSAGAGG